MCVVMMVLAPHAESVDAGLYTEPQSPLSAPFLWPTSSSVAQSEHLTHGTVWDPTFSPPAELLRSPAGMLEEALSLFPCGTFDVIDVAPIQAKLEALPVHRLCLYEWHCAQHNTGGSELPPDLNALWRKAPLHASAARQSKPGGARDSLGALIPPYLGKDAHIPAALGLTHPFAEAPRLEQDLMSRT
jgi:hypothetical protein